MRRTTLFPFSMGVDHVAAPSFFFIHDDGSRADAPAPLAAKSSTHRLIPPATLDKAKPAQGISHRTQWSALVEIVVAGGSEAELNLTFRRLSIELSDFWHSSNFTQHGFGHSARAGHDGFGTRVITASLAPQGVRRKDRHTEREHHKCGRNRES